MSNTSTHDDVEQPVIDAEAAPPADDDAPRGLLRRLADAASTAHRAGVPF